MVGHESSAQTIERLVKENIYLKKRVETLESEASLERHKNQTVTNARCFILSVQEQVIDIMKQLGLFKDDEEVMRKYEIEPRHLSEVLEYYQHALRTQTPIKAPEHVEHRVQHGNGCLMVFVIGVLAWLLV